MPEQDSPIYTVIEMLNGIISQVLIFTDYKKAKRTFKKFAKVNSAEICNSSACDEDGYEVHLLEAGIGD